MSELIIVDNEFIAVKYLGDRGVIYHTIKKPIPDQSFKDALNAGTRALQENDVCKWLSDDRRNGLLSPELVEWSRVEWSPRTMAAGWKYWANVVPVEVASAGSLTPVIENLYELGLRMMVFTDVDSAFEWLDSLES